MIASIAMIGVNRGDDGNRGNLPHPCPVMTASIAMIGVNRGDVGNLGNLGNLGNAGACLAPARPSP
jgi:hypothetical protein